MTGMTGDTGTGVVLPTDCTVLTWQNFGKGFMDTWCNACHSSSLAGVDRQGAPDGVNFEHLEDVRLWAARIDARATPTPPTMPVAGGNTELERQQLKEWLDCGAPGEELPPPQCSVLSSAPGAHAFADQAEADAFCEGSDNAIEGALSLGTGVEVTCLCEVGSVAVDAAATGHVVLPQLRHVRGDIEAVGTGLEGLVMERLEAVDGGLAVRDNAELASVDLRVADVIAGDIDVQGNPALVDLDLSRLLTAGGDVTLVDNDALVDLFPSTVSLLTVGGDVTLGANAALTDVGFLSLATVGGAIDIYDNDALVELAGFTFGMGFNEVTIRDHAQLEVLRGFDNARTLESLTISDNPVLLGVTGFVNLGEVSGTLAFRGGDAFDSFVGLTALLTVGSLEVDGVAGMRSLDGLDNLATVTGDLVVRGNTGLEKINGLGVTTIGGSLMVDDNDRLDAIVSLFGVDTIGADLVVTGNALLDPRRVDELVDQIGAEDIGGAVIAYDNGP